MSETRLSQIVRRQSSLLEDLFDGDAYEIIDTAPDACELRTSWVAVELTYSWRDQWVDTQLKPLMLPDDISETYPGHSWLKSCGIEVGAARKSSLDDQQVIDALNLVRPIVSLFKDGQAARDALWFVRGYSHAYTDWASGNWD
jgi:hypothetical protein